MLAQIHFAHFGVVQNGIGVALRDNYALANDVGFLANIERLAHIMVGDQHTDIFIAQMFDDVFDVVD